MTPHRLLLVDDDRSFRVSTAELLRQDGYVVVEAADGIEAGRALRDDRFDLMLLDLRMPGPDGKQVVETLRRRGDGIPILMISGFGTVAAAVEAMHLGADDFLTKPVEPSVLSARVLALLNRRPLEERVYEDAFAGMVGVSATMRGVFERIRRAAPTDETVLITGETGTGKELAARAIHDRSGREGPFVPVNCAALSETLLESELFGHVRGAFTGAVSDRKGLFEAARGGTLLLDEIGDVSPGVQKRLLRVIQEREIRRVGSVRQVPVDVRLVATTARNLDDEVATGRFREDLLYRLKVVSIVMPPLRERAGDIPLLLEAGLNELGDKRSGLTCSPLTFRLLASYPWPGNVRQLFAVIRAAAIATDGSQITADRLPPEIRGDGQETMVPNGSTADAAHDPDVVRAALTEAEGSRVRAARILGISRTTLWRRMKEHAIEDDYDIAREDDDGERDIRNGQDIECDVDDEA